MIDAGFWIGVIVGCALTATVAAAIASLSIRSIIKAPSHWGRAPLWANYWAVDANGESFWYESIPHPGMVAWVMEGQGRVTFDGIRENVPGMVWQDTLERREDYT